MFRPKLPHRKDYVEIEMNGERVYKNIKSNKIYKPNDIFDETTEKVMEIENLLKQTQFYADLIYISMMTNIDLGV